MNRADVGALLRRALERSADGAGIELTIRRSALTRWASATFAGARHELALVVAASAGAWLAGLPDADLPLSGHLVADLKIVTLVREGTDLVATLEILTVEDR